MALNDLTIDHPIEVAPSEVETNRFGYGIGRCTVPIGSTARPAEIARKIDRSDYDIVFLRYPANRVKWFGHLVRELQPYVLLHADTLVYWELTVGAGRPPTSDDDIATAPADDSAVTGDLTTRVFTGYVNHYSANPLLSAEAAAAGYREWAMRTPLGNSLVLSVNESPAGVATLDRTSDHVEILLAGVVPELRGRGMYPHLLHGVETDALSSGVERMVISTQAHNKGVQRAWARYGFLPMEAFTTVHVIDEDVWSAGKRP